MYKVFMRPDLNYDDMIYDEAYKGNISPKNSVYSMQSLSNLIRAARGLSREKIYRELGMEFLRH